jgi:hypothetical protein
VGRWAGGHLEGVGVEFGEEAHGALVLALGEEVVGEQLLDLLQLFSLRTPIAIAITTAAAAAIVVSTHN